MNPSMIKRIYVAPLCTEEEDCGECEKCSIYCDFCAIWYGKEDRCPWH